MKQATNETNTDWPAFVLVPEERCTGNGCQMTVTWERRAVKRWQNGTPYVDYTALGGRVLPIANWRSENEVPAARGDMIVELLALRAEVAELRATTPTATAANNDGHESEIV